MSKYNAADVNGCNYTMSVLQKYFKTPIEWTHTTTTEGEFCHYDMSWLYLAYKAAVENKDRRNNWETGEPQYYSTYDTIMFEVDKYNELMKLWKNKGLIPIYTAAYTDGVAVFDLRTLPPTCVTDWVAKKMVRTNTVEKGEKKPFIKMFIPKDYGKFYAA